MVHVLELFTALQGQSWSLAAKFTVPCVVPCTLELILPEMIAETEAAHSSVVSGGFYSEGIVSNQTPRKRYFFITLDCCFINIQAGLGMEHSGRALTTCLAYQTSNTRSSPQ